MSDELTQAELDGLKMAEYLKRGYKGVNCFISPPGEPGVYYTTGPDNPDRFTAEEVDEIKRLFGTKAMIFLPDNEGPDE